MTNRPTAGLGALLLVALATGCIDVEAWTDQLGLGGGGGGEEAADEGICVDPELDGGWIYDEKGLAYVIDADQDGIGITEDCWDLDPEIGGRQWLFHDYDRDGFGGDAVWVCANFYEVDAGELMVTTGGDCDDTSRFTHPGAVEECDGEDNDCDGLVDDDDRGDLDADDAGTFWLDVDGDGLGRPYTGAAWCAAPEGWVDNDDDCDDDRRDAPCQRE